jgi:hypothetical protein
MQPEAMQHTASDTDAGFQACPPLPGCAHCGESASRAGARRPDWGFLDGAYCISLRHRDDRALDAARELHRVGLCARAVFHRPTKDRIAKRGCWESHRAVAAHARARGLRRVLILEDDVLFAPSVSTATADRVGAALVGLPMDWMGFYLGHWALWAYPISRHVLRCSSLCTHAYVASERLLDWLCETPFERGRSLVRSGVGGNGLDSAFAVLPGMYACFPLIAVQRFVPNDHMKSTRIRIRPLRKLLLDLFVRSRVRELAMAHAMGLNEKLVLGLAPVLVPAFRAWHRSARRRAERPLATAASPDVAPPLR